MLDALNRWLAGKPGVRRSKEWPRVRAAHLATHPECAACGGRKALEVHHIEPFHVRPERELDPTNLLTLCEARGRNCHFALGHAYQWRGWVSTAVDDAAAFRQRVEASARMARGIT